MRPRRLASTSFGCLGWYEGGGKGVASLTPLEKLRIAQFLHKGPGTAWSGVQGADSPLVGSGVKPRRYVQL